MTKLKCMRARIHMHAFSKKKRIHMYARKFCLLVHMPSKFVIFQEFFYIEFVHQLAYKSRYIRYTQCVHRLKFFRRVFTFPQEGGLHNKPVSMHIVISSSSLSLTVLVIYA
jgi:hypothetical protein